MSMISRSDRRGFVARGMAIAAAGWSAIALKPADAAAQAGGDDAWIKEVPGTKRCFFDCPQHMNGFGLLHILNYLGAYQPGQAGVVSMTVNETWSPVISRSRIMLRVTRS